MGMLSARAEVVITENGRNEMGLVDVAAISNGSSRLQWWWATNTLRVTNWHWLSGEHIALEAVGVEFPKEAIDVLVSRLPAPDSRLKAVAPLSAAGLPVELQDDLSMRVKRCASSEWWDWPEAIRLASALVV